MLVVFPHPDDESVMAGGIIQRAMRRGFKVTVLTLTEGSRGKIHINGKGRSVSEIRRQEMAEAMSRLGVMDWVMWKFDDGKLKRTKKWRERLTTFIIDTHPGVVVTYDLSGVTGHPDHISASLVVLRVLRKMTGVYMLWVSFDGRMKEKIVDKRAAKYLHKPTLELNMTILEARRKWRAVFAHRSQALGGFLRSSWWLLMFWSRKEWYSEAKFEAKQRYKFVNFKI
ncbi:MAG: N-acetylglucosaminyl phosphatidylinositol deacetylase [Microgenomates group bacterium GW2011_GWC1_44_37]|uniref:N-acetylglucosaminyl phosphatidylinositol deacetylase n=1 Tax=Candidatus Collierbacteria bacterium GW2011_GWB2_44_22 TaxID=1618387 RepID=A0A0G1HXK1_9BACT|nr:MAG: N-acetylglucosaminyl phosphatidylinositol deacetylase [Candidatus Collierbacteria bacterium GW2011_GWA2_44_13]KKT51660.1 MAG: N-acetylglucosaminyl phosphatidylinositol deacetylase [Candidatus Collierbacteria bacterium GW2011_GWB2_44_22]KKT62588.1 MAG: N-acetylglucosaminyl phosphatidylinositol deacetylase [Candidatus Collierbacteria bacterium GW2011_GWD1_44_27]KKT68515.1 MAG: N-acetylglucosaminyl phosphatidylinositol deacetylase [Microgenomates group bacterium GW2011_GWC1_44_37]KKT89634.